MNTIKLSLNALAALGYLMLFMTSCQEDAVENDLLPAQEADAAQTSVPEDVLQLLHSVAESSPEVVTNSGARTNQSAVLEYDLSLTVSELEPFDQPGEELQTLAGRLTLWPVDSTDIFNFVDLGGRDFQLYQGGYVATTASGATVRRRAAAVLIEAEENFFVVEILNVPGVNASIIIPESFNPMSDSEGRGLGAGRVFITYESDFIEHDDMPEEPVAIGDTLSYRLGFDLLDTDPEQPDLSIRNLVDVLFGTLNLVPVEALPEGALDVEPSVNLEDDPVYVGTFEFTDDDNNPQVRPVVAAVDVASGLGYLAIEQVLGTTEGAGDIFIVTPTFRPDLPIVGISFNDLTALTNPPTGNPELPEVLAAVVNGQLIGEPSLPQPDIAADYRYDVSVAITRPDGRPLVELTTPGRLDARLFVNNNVGARYFFFTSDSINSSASFQGTLTDDGTIALVSTRSVLGSAFEEDIIPSPGLNKLVITNLPTLENREAVPEAIAFDLAGEPLGEVAIEATITRVIVDGEEVDL